MSAHALQAPARAAHAGADRRRLGGRRRRGQPRHRLYAARSGAFIPSRPSTADTQRYYRSVEELPAAPDAAFIAAPNREVPAIAAALARRGAGGFVCFAAGFSETGTAEGRRLTAGALESAGELPFFGPNCYGFINFFDGAALWPDQVVGRRRERGVALICQSGTHRAQPAVQRPLAADRLRPHGGQSDPPRRRRI